MKRVVRKLLFPFVAVLISIGLVTAFHDTLVRWIALRLVQQVPGIEAQFEGPFDVTHVVPLTLDAAGVELTFTGDRLTGTHARFGSVHLEMRLWPLLRGMVHIERLLIADADIEIPPVGAAGSVASLIGPLPIDPGHWTLKAEIKGEGNRDTHAFPRPEKI